jgi:hypothetical protein
LFVRVNLEGYMLDKDGEVEEIMAKVFNESDLA